VAQVEEPRRSKIGVPMIRPIRAITFPFAVFIHGVTDARNAFHRQAYRRDIRTLKKFT
jgi:hypothetical protein